MRTGHFIVIAMVLFYTYGEYQYYTVDKVGAGEAAFRVAFVGASLWFSYEVLHRVIKFIKSKFEGWGEQ